MAWRDGTGWGGAAARVRACATRNAPFFGRRINGPAETDPESVLVVPSFLPCIGVYGVKCKVAGPWPHSHIFYTMYGS